MKDTSYTEDEASKIDCLPWYNDRCLNERVLALLSPASHRNSGAAGRCLLDLCCGTCFLMPQVASAFQRYVGVDSSPFMLRVAEQRVRSLSVNVCSVELHELEILDFLNSGFDFSGVTHVLLKNCIQLLDIRLVLERLQRNCGRNCDIVMVQTVAIDGSHGRNLFSLFGEHSFVRRVRKCYQLEELVEIANLFSQAPPRFEDLVQQIEVDAWLDYHGVTSDEREVTLAELRCLSHIEQKRFGLSLAGSSILTTRRQAIVNFEMQCLRTTHKSQDGGQMDALDNYSAGAT